MWEYLPDSLLEEIFALLSISDRYSCSQVCWRWYQAFYAPRVWHTFHLFDRTLTRRRFNYYTGYQHTLDHYRTQMCLHKMGGHFRRLFLGPMTNLFNLYEFMALLCFFAERGNEEGRNPYALVHTLDFTFVCTSTDNPAGSEQIFGTGGKLLQGLRRLMKDLPGLRRLELRNLLLDKHEAVDLLDDVVENCCETLTFLSLINCTKEPYAFLHAGVFLRLRTLRISPQQLDADVINLLACTELRDMYVVQTRFTECLKAVPARTWRQVRKSAPKLRVHLCVEGRVRTEVVWQEGAPVYSVVYNSPYVAVTPLSTLTPATLFAGDLQVYGHLGLPRFYVPRLFEDRADSPLVLLVRSCPKLHTLVVRERISTATVLLLAHEGAKRALRRLVVRRNAVVKRCEWPLHPDWTLDFFRWLRAASRSYERVEKEVSAILGIKWRFFSDYEFTHFSL